MLKEFMSVSFYFPCDNKANLMVEKEAGVVA